MGYFAEGYLYGTAQEHWSILTEPGEVSFHMHHQTHVKNPNVNQASCYLNMFGLNALAYMLNNLLDCSLCCLKSDTNTPWS